MKAVIKAGGEIDFLTKNELKDTLWQAIYAHYMHGIQLKTITFTQTDPGLNNQMSMSPPKGFMWDVRSLYSKKSVADTVRLYRDSTATAQMGAIVDDGDNGNWITFPRGARVIRGGQSLIVQAKQTGTQIVSTVLSVMEVPDGHDWHLK